MRETTLFPALYDRGPILLPNTMNNGSWCSLVDGMSDPRNLRKADDRFPPYPNKVRRFAPSARWGFFCIASGGGALIISGPS